MVVGQVARIGCGQRLESSERLGRDDAPTGSDRTDDTAAINAAISDGNRCGQGCDSSTISPALVFFPAGSYLLTSPIISYYYTQLVGDYNSRPTLITAPSFAGIAAIDEDPYLPGGANWYTNQVSRSAHSAIVQLLTFSSRCAEQLLP